MAIRYLIPAVALAVTTASGIAAATETAATIPPVDPAAVSALETMSSYLRSLPSYTIEANISKDEVIEGNGKLQFDHVLKVSYVKGKGLSMDSSSAQWQRTYFYNHKQFTLYTPRTRFYSTVDAPATILATLAAIEDKYGVNLPLSDIFLWGTEAAPTDAIEAAFLVGTGRVDGQDCQHYAYRQAEVDWQICIANGDKPLPLKLVITTTDIAIQPEYIATMQWDLNADIKADSFTFAPPAGAEPITFLPVATATAAQQ
jgi:hypothetical protein